MTEKIKGGLADGKSIPDIAKHHKKELTSKQFESLVRLLSQELKKGIKVEKEHTDSPAMAREIAMDHIYEDPEYYTKLAKMEGDKPHASGAYIQDGMAGEKDRNGHPIPAICPDFSKMYGNHEAEGDVDECTDAGASGSFSAPMGFVTKKELYKHNNKEIPKEVPEQEMGEATTTAVSANGQYDVAFGAGKDGLKIEGPKSIMKSRAVTDPNFPKFGGDGTGGNKSNYVKPKDKCKTFPYCNQGDQNNLDLYEIKGMKDIIQDMVKKYHISENEVKKIVLKGIK